MRHVVDSAAEAEYAGIFINAQNAVPLRVALEEMKHQQPPTPICTDNTTASGIVNKTTKPRISKSMGMRFHWIRDRIFQNQFEVFWEPGQVNMGDYFSKHHPPSHHRKHRNHFLLNYAYT